MRTLTRVPSGRFDVLTAMSVKGWLVSKVVVALSMPSLRNTSRTERSMTPLMFHEFPDHRLFVENLIREKHVFKPACASSIEEEGRIAAKVEPATKVFSRL